MKKLSYVFLTLLLITVISCKKEIEQKTDKLNLNITGIEKSFDKENIIDYDTPVNNEQKINEEPKEFSEKYWNSNFGYLFPVDNITLTELQLCSWQRNNTILLFSEEGNYAKMGRDGRDFGKYTLKDNKVYFYPPVNLIIFTEENSIEYLQYSNTMYFEGSPVLINDDETVVFTSNNPEKAELGETVKLHKHYCKKIWGKTEINENNVLYSQPDISSLNMFKDSYYGKKSTEAKTVKLAKTQIDDVVWYYLLIDFTKEEPTDGGGPFFEGWLPEEYLD